MSLVRLDSGEFPPLDMAGQQNFKVNGSKAKINGNDNSRLCGDALMEPNGKFSPILNNPSSQASSDEQRADSIISGSDFVRCRVGYQLNNYHEDLAQVLKSNHIGFRLDFILAPIEPIRPVYYANNFEAISDLTLPGDEWQSSVAINLGYPPLDYYDAVAAKHFEQLFCHALYLSTSVIVIDCPESEVAYISVAATVNARLAESPRDIPLVLFKIPPSKRSQGAAIEWPLDEQDSLIGQKSTINDGSFNEHNTSMEEEPMLAQERLFRKNSNDKISPWRHWNAIRSHLIPDRRVGVCLVLNDDLTDDRERLASWEGEPVRMIILNTDLFVQSPGLNGTPKLTRHCADFVTKIILANSLKTSLVLEGQARQNIKFHLQYLNYLINTIRIQNGDYLRNWDDRMQPPLQPLSMNLDSCTYRVFEMDRMKYIKYKEAMIAALGTLIARGESPDKQFTLMVLGAGRGPLVDSFIEAIMAVNTHFKFKIYALDKNPSSIRALKYKKNNHWTRDGSNFETEVVEHDMRTWEPGVKADIIATELLGSLSDNELSPECIDGVWRLSTSATISIPLEYSSYINPMCSYKLNQELYKAKSFEENVYDRIYVVKLTNCYHISEPQRLFKFEHRDLSLSPGERCNTRYTRLVFWSKVDTVCHGFGGYFSANLFGNVSLSTLLNHKTPNMDSWFPAFIPLEGPVQLPKDTKLEVHFWRKESSSKVWYEWVVTHPTRSRIYSLDGFGTAMSKFT